MAEAQQRSSCHRERPQRASSERLSPMPQFRRSRLNICALRWPELLLWSPGSLLAEMWTLSAVLHCFACQHTGYRARHGARASTASPAIPPPSRRLACVKT